MKMSTVVVSAVVAVSGFLTVGCADPETPTPVEPVVVEPICGPTGDGRMVCDYDRYAEYMKQAQAEVDCIVAGRPYEECMG